MFFCGGSSQGGGQSRQRQAGREGQATPLLRRAEERLPYSGQLSAPNTKPLTMM